jgi:GH25 family lysozyme M1 (1,4-beta-N-acetylmuramidase)
MKMIDVSEFQGKIDFKKVKADGIEGVIIRAGYGKGNSDEYFVRNINGAIKNKLHVGIYWFSYAYTEEMARREARYCNDLIQTYKLNIDMPVFFDWEYDSMDYARKNGVEPDKDLITRMTEAFCAEIESLGYKAGYYTNWDYANNYYDGKKLKKYDLWFADYEDEYEDCYLQQITSTGVVKGISGNVDMDVLRGKVYTESPSEAQGEPQKKESAPSANSPSKAKEKPKKSQEKYIVDDVYTVVASALNVRKGPGMSYSLVGYAGLTDNAKEHAYYNGSLMQGTRVTCLEVKVLDADNIWIRIPSGWICAVRDGNVYVE